MTEAQIFRLHASKQALFRAAIFTPLNRHFADFQARSASDPGKGRDVAAAYIGELQEFMARHARMFLSLLVTNAYSPEASAGIDALDGLQDYFRQGEAMSQRRLGENPRWRPSSWCASPLPPCWRTRCSVSGFSPPAWRLTTRSGTRSPPSSFRGSRRTARSDVSADGHAGPQLASLRRWSSALLAG
ncbi:hypothetical protein ACFSHP_14070 [Novosphingobium panipatense]